MKKSCNFMIYYKKNRIEVLFFIFLFITWLIFYLPIYRSGFIYWNDIDLYSSLCSSETINNSQKIEPFLKLISIVHCKYRVTQAATFHYLSTFFHIATTVFVFYLLTNIFSFFIKKDSSKLIAIFCSLIFCFNPVNADAVYWMYSIKEITFTMLCFASLTCYLIYFKNYNAVWNYFFSILLIVFACLSSRYCYQAVCFFIIFTFVLPSQKNIKFKFISLVPFLLIVALSFFLYYKNGYYQNSVISINSYKDLFIYINTAIVTVKDLIVPVNLTFYTAPIEQISQLQINDLVFSIVIMLTICFLFIRSIVWKDKLLFISTLFILILPFISHTFVESSNISKLHFLNYATTIGISLIVGVIIIKVNLYNEKPRNQIVFGLVSILIVFGAISSFRKMEAWKNEVTLWSSVIEQYPKNQFAKERKRQAIQFHKSQIFNQFGDDVPKVIFSSNSIDLGVTDSIKKNVRFEFKNSGNSPIIISNVSASCGCTSANWTNSPVLPNKTGEINATINFENIKGYFSKTIAVKFNNCNEPFVLTVKGSVQNRI